MKHMTFTRSRAKHKSLTFVHIEQDKHYVHIRARLVPFSWVVKLPTLCFCMSKDAVHCCAMPCKTWQSPERDGWESNANNFFDFFPSVFRLFFSRQFLDFSQPNCELGIGRLNPNGQNKVMTVVQLVIPDCFMIAGAFLSNQNIFFSYTV